MGDLSLKELKDLLDENDLDLSARNLTAVPKALAQVARATRIDLSNNKLTSLPPDLPQWTRITKLELGNNRLVQLPDDFGRLFNLKYLDLYKNQIEELPLSFADLTSLQWLDLKNNPLEPALAQAAGKCGNDKECKEAAAKVRQHITGLRDALKKKVEEPLLFVIMMQAEKNEAMLKKVREKEAAQLQQQKEAEKAKKKENRKAKQANHQEQQARNETQKHEQKSREQTTNASSNTANKKSQPAGDKKSGSFFGRFIMGLVRLILWSFVLTTIVVGASLFVNCRFPAYRWLKAADVQPICKDTAKAFSGFSIPDSAPTSLNRALNALVQDAQRRIQRNEWGSWLLSVAYKVHAVIVEYVLLGYKIILQQWNKIVAWWDREGRDSFGGVADSIVLTGKIMLEIVKDIWAFWMKALDVLYNRINLLVDTVQAKGFSKTVQDFFQGH